MCDIDTDIIHRYFSKVYIFCPFCNEQISVKSVIRYDYCCKKQNIQKDEKSLVCINCGQTHGCYYMKEYIDFHENKYKFRRKSVYNRKYHIENTLNKIQQNDRRINLSRKQITKLCEIFDKIEQKPINNRRRMISVNFIIVKIFKIVSIPTDKIKITKSKKTLEFYENYWDSIKKDLKSDIKLMRHR